MRRADDLQVGKVMAGAPFLETVPRKALDRFASQGAVHRFRRGTYLCHQGDPDGDVFFLVSGGSRENVTRILPEWQRRGLVEREGHRYVLKKVSSLAKIADL